MTKRRRPRPVVVQTADPSRKAHARLVMGPVVELAGQQGMMTAQCIKKLRRRIKAGDTLALLDAVDLCLRAGIPVPAWLATEFCRRFMAWRLFQAASLDEAFAATRPKRQRIQGRANDEWLKFQHLGGGAAQAGRRACRRQNVRARG
jgi:hypothetical protein